jgi:hypothetical protein
LKSAGTAGHQWWLIPVIPATQEAEIRRVKIKGPVRQTALKTPSRKHSTQKRTVGVAREVAKYPMTHRMTPPATKIHLVPNANSAKVGKFNCRELDEAVGNFILHESSIQS